MTFSAAQVHAEATAGSVDWVARGIGIAGVLISLLSIAVTVFLWRRSGWHLDVWALAGVRQDGCIEISVTVTNTGRLAAVVAWVRVMLEHEGKGRWRSGIDMPAVLEGDPAPRILAPSESLSAVLLLDQDLAPQYASFRASAGAGGRTYLAERERFPSAVE